MKTVFLRNGAYWGAGKTYKWLNDFPNHSRQNEVSWGLGIPKEYLEGNQDIYIRNAHYGKYVIGSVYAKMWCDKYNSYKTIRGKELAILPCIVCDVI